MMHLTRCLTGINQRPFVAVMITAGQRCPRFTESVKANSGVKKFVLPLSIKRSSAASGSSCIVMATDGLDPKAVGRIQFGQREGLVGLVLESGQPLSITNAQQHPHFRYFPEYGEEAYHAFLGVPIIHYRQVLGVL